MSLRIFDDNFLDEVLNEISCGGDKNFNILKCSFENKFQEIADLEFISKRKIQEIECDIFIVSKFFETIIKAVAVNDINKSKYFESICNKIDIRNNDFYKNYNLENEFEQELFTIIEKAKQII